MSNNRGWKRFLAMLLSVTMLLSIVSIGYAEGATAQPAEVAETVAPAEEAPAELPSVDEIIVDVNRPETAWDEGDDFDLTAKAGSTLKAKISANAFQGEFINSQGILSLGAGGKYTFKVSDFEIVSGTTTANPELELVAVSVKRNSTKYIAYNRTEFRIKGNKANGMATVRVKVREKGTDNECVLDVKAKKVGAPTTFAISPATVIAPAEGATYVLTQGGLKGGVSQADTMLEVNPPVNAEVTYTVSPADGAVTVDANGKVTVAPVTAETLGAKYTVTATSYNGKKATLTINMAEEPVEPASKLVVTPAKTQLAVGAESTVNLTASVQGEAASLEGIEWKVDNAAATLKVDAADPTKATLTVPETIVTPGKITVTATAGDLTGTAVVELDYKVVSVTIDTKPLEGYALVKGSYEIPEGTKVQLTADVKLTTDAPSAAKYTGSIVWKSLYPAVATVDETGLVTVKTGVVDLTTVITATAQDVPSNEVSIKAIADYNTVKIYKSDDTEETDINGETFYLAPGDRGSVTLTAEPTYVPKADKAAVTWSSSNSTLAQVTSEGVVTFSDTLTGDVVITATASNGATGSVTYKLISGEQTPSYVSIDGYGKGDVEATVAAGSTVRLSATVYTTDDTVAAIQDVTWERSDDNGKYVTEFDEKTGVFTVGDWDGTDTFKVTARSSYTGVAAASITFTVIPYAVTGLDLTIEKDKTSGMSGSGTKEDPYVLDADETKPPYTAKVTLTPDTLNATTFENLYVFTAVDADGEEVKDVVGSNNVIDLGKITGKTVAITAATTDGGAKSDTIYVTTGVWKIELAGVDYDGDPLTAGQGTESAPWQYTGNTVYMKVSLNDTPVTSSVHNSDPVFEYRYNVGGTWTDWGTKTLEGDNLLAIRTGRITGADVTVQVRSTATPSAIATAYFKYVKTADVITADDIKVEITYGTYTGDGSFEKPYVFDAVDADTANGYGEDEFRVKVSVTNPNFSLAKITVPSLTPVTKDGNPVPGEYYGIHAAALNSFTVKYNGEDLATKYYVQALADYQKITKLDISKVDGKSVPASNSESNPLVLAPKGDMAVPSGITVTITPASATDPILYRVEEKTDEVWEERYVGTDKNYVVDKTPGALYRITVVAANSGVADVAYVKIAQKVKAATVTFVSGVTIDKDYSSQKLPYTATSANPVVSVAVTDPATGALSAADAGIKVYYKATDDENDVGNSEELLADSTADWMEPIEKTGGVLELKLERGTVYKVQAITTDRDVVDAKATTNVFFIQLPYSTPSKVTSLGEFTARYWKTGGTKENASYTGSGTAADPYTFEPKADWERVLIGIKKANLKFDIEAGTFDLTKVKYSWGNTDTAEKRALGTTASLPYKLGEAKEADYVLKIWYDGVEQPIGAFYFRYKAEALKSITLSVNEEDFKGGTGTFADPYVITTAADNYSGVMTTDPADHTVDSEIYFFTKAVTAAVSPLPTSKDVAAAQGYEPITSIGGDIEVPEPNQIKIVLAIDENCGIVSAMYVVGAKKDLPDSAKLIFDERKYDEKTFKPANNSVATTDGKVYVTVSDDDGAIKEADKYDWTGVTVQYKLGYLTVGDAFAVTKTGNAELTLDADGQMAATVQPEGWYQITNDEDAYGMEVGNLEQPYALKLGLYKDGKLLGAEIEACYVSDFGLLGE